MNWDSINLFFSQIIHDLGELFLDLFLWILQLIVDLVVYLVDILPLPDFVQTYDIASLVPPEIIWFLNQSGFSTALGILGSAVLFKLLRKLLTLGIW